MVKETLNQYSWIRFSNIDLMKRKSTQSLKIAEL